MAIQNDPNKRLKISSTVNNGLTMKIGSQQSDDSTLRYNASQASEATMSQQQAMLLLRDTERATRLEGKLDEMLKGQKEINENLTKLADRLEQQRQQVTQLSQQQALFTQVMEPPSPQQLPLAAPPRTAWMPDSDEEDESLFTNEWPVSAEDLFSQARKAREHRLKQHRNKTKTPSATVNNHTGPSKSVTVSDSKLPTKRNNSVVPSHNPDSSTEHPLPKRAASIQASAVLSTLARSERQATMKKT